MYDISDLEASWGERDPMLAEQTATHRAVFGRSDGTVEVPVSTGLGT